MSDFEKVAVQDRPPPPAPSTHFVEPQPPILVDNGGQPACVMRLTTRGLLNSQAIFFSWDYMQLTPGILAAQSPIPTSILQELVNKWGTTILTPLLVNSVSTYSITDVLATQISAYVVAGQPTTPTGFPKIGTVSGEALPQNEAYVVSKYTTWRGRRGRGRVFIAGIPIAMASHGMMTSAYFNAINPAVWALVGAGFVLSTTQWTPCVTHGRVNHVPTEPDKYELGVRGAIMSGYKINLDFRTQRRRNIGRGI